MSHSLDFLKDQLRRLQVKNEEAMSDLMFANRQLVRAQTDVADIEREIEQRVETMKDIEIGIETLEKYGA